MKKFSKESMQNFMLLHAEKLILGGCIAATGLLIWTSISGEEANTKTPSDLKSEVESADTYINLDAWGTLEPFRQGEADAKDRIENAKLIDPDPYKFALIGNVAPATAPRQDPELFAPEQLIGQRFTAGILMDLPNVRSPLALFNKAPTRSEDGGSGFQGFQGTGGDDLGAGGSGNRNDAGFDRAGLPESYIPLDRSGIFNEVNALTLNGLRPQAFGISADKITTNVLDVVAVTAVVDFQKQMAAYENAFSQSVAYNDRRDRPVYQFLEVHRREVSDKETEWEDISENVTYNYPQQYPKSLVKMPLQIFRSAPEVVAPGNYDPILSQVIPAFVMMDYQSLASHPALKQRREFPAWSRPDEKRMMGQEGGQAIPGAGLFGAGRGGATDDIGSGSEDGTDALRKGSETKSYKEAIVQRNQGGQYRLVRFFDLFLPTQESRSKTYEYRTRVWLGDPNQLDPNDGFRKNRGLRLEADPEGLVKFAGVSGGEASSGMADMDDMGKGAGDDGFEGEKKELVQDVNKSMVTPAVRKRINGGIDLQLMQDRFQAAARKLYQLSVSGNANPDRNNEAMEPLYVSELTETGELEKISLPLSTANYAYSQYLRFARPSPWSETVRVEGAPAPADVYAGKTVRARSTSMNVGSKAVEFELAEPYIEVVASSWIRRMGTKLPSKRKVFLGEMLNFNSPAYVTHPITWEILAAERPGARQDDAEKFDLPFRTGTTIVDAFYGEQRELPDNKKLTLETPTEILTMDSNGNLRVSNQFEVATKYRNEIAEPDNSRFYGRARRQRKTKDEEEDSFGFDEN